jgi:cation transport regulator ChaC
MSEESLRATVPDCKDLAPAYINGFRREFNLLDQEGWVSSNLDVGGVPFCAVNLAVDRPESRLNGVAFRVDEKYLAVLRQREAEYDLIETSVYDFMNDEPLGICFAFAAKRSDGRYRFGEPAQERYLEVCLDAAREHGDAFYKAFLKTTHLNGKRLDQLPALRFSPRK